MNYRSALQIFVTLLVLAAPLQASSGQDISPPDGAGADPGTATPAPAAPPADGAAPADQQQQTGTGTATDQPAADADKEKTDKKAEEDSDEADKKKEEAEKQAAALEELAKKKVPYDPVRQALFDLNSRHYDKCLATLDKVLSENPSHPQAHYVRAVAYVMTRQYPKAAADYREVIRLVPNSDLGKRAEKGLKNLNF